MIKEILKNNKKSIVLFTGVFILCLLINLAFTNWNLDNVWNFHMIQKINSGYIPYKEINVIITPLFHFIGCIFMRVFGNTFLSFYIYGSAINALIAVLSYKIFKKITDKKEFIILGVSLIVIILQYLYIPNYNMLIIIFPLLLILLEWKRDKLLNDNNLKATKKTDFIIGIVLALVCLTKQTVGGIYVFAYVIYLLIYDRVRFGKVNWKSIIRKVLGALCIMVPFLVYLIVTDSFIPFLDLCFGGIIDFGEKNYTGNMFDWHVIINLCISNFCFLWFKHRKDMKGFLLGVLSVASIIFVFPLANSFHLTVQLIIPVITLIYVLEIIFNNLQKEKSKKRFLFSSYIVSLAIFAITICWGINIVDTFVFLSPQEGLEVYCGMSLSEYESNEIKKVINYIKEKEAEGFNVHILSARASIYMIPLERNNNKYDLLLQGNLGYKGEERIIKEIEQIENPLFLKTDELIFQESVIVDDFIKENYKEIDKICEFTVYTK